MIYKDVIPQSDLLAYERAGLGKRMGFGTKPAVLIIDVEYRVVDPSHDFVSGDTGWKAVGAIRALLNEARDKDVPIIYCKRSYENADTSSYFTISRKYTRGPSSNPRANDIVDEIAPLPGEVVIKKTRASIFFGTNLVSLLNSLNIDTLIITGATTSGCLRAGVIDAASYGYKVIVPEECAFDRAVVPHKVDLFDMDMKYADVVSLDEVLKYLRTLEKKKIVA